MTTQTTAAPRRKCVMFNLTFSSHYDFAFCTFLCFTLPITVVSQLGAIVVDVVLLLVFLRTANWNVTQDPTPVAV